MSLYKCTYNLCFFSCVAAVFIFQIIFVSVVALVLCCLCHFYFFVIDVICFMGVEFTPGFYMTTISRLLSNNNLQFIFKHSTIVIAHRQQFISCWTKQLELVNLKYECWLFDFFGVIVLFLFLLHMSFSSATMLTFQIQFICHYCWQFCLLMGYVLLENITRKYTHAYPHSHISDTYTHA